MSPFYLVPGLVVAEILASAKSDVLQAVQQAYRLYEAGEAFGPDSCFLRFPSKPESRVIALPGYVGGDVDTVGIKWISSFPSNARAGLPRASAVLILNDYDTGRPCACLEAAGISAARTAASAATACQALYRHGQPDAVDALQYATVAFVGTGVIARAIATTLRHVGAGTGMMLAYDVDASRAIAFGQWARHDLGVAEFRVSGLKDALAQDIVVFATTADRPYIAADTKFQPGQLVLHISLRDLDPAILLAANNVVDDVDHCLTAQTSPHLAAQLSGSRDFVNGTIAQAMDRLLRLDSALPTIFSPFGLGVLDIAVGDLVLRRAKSDPRVVMVADFIAE